MCGLGYRLWWNRRSLCWRKARTWHGAARVGVGKNRTKRRSVVAFRWPRRLSQGGVHQLLDLQLRQVVARAGRRSYKKPELSLRGFEPLHLEISSGELHRVSTGWVVGRTPATLFESAAGAPVIRDTQVWVLPELRIPNSKMRRFKSSRPGWEVLGELQSKMQRFALRVMSGLQ